MNAPNPDTPDTPESPPQPAPEIEVNPGSHPDEINLDPGRETPLPERP